MPEEENVPSKGWKLKGLPCKILLELPPNTPKNKYQKHGESYGFAVSRDSVNLTELLPVYARKTSEGGEPSKT